MFARNYPVHFKPLGTVDNFQPYPCRLALNSKQTEQQRGMYTKIGKPIGRV